MKEASNWFGFGFGFKGIRNTQSTISRLACAQKHMLSVFLPFNILASVFHIAVLLFLFAIRPHKIVIAALNLQGDSLEWIHRLF